MSLFTLTAVCFSSLLVPPAAATEFLYFFLIYFVLSAGTGRRTAMTECEVEDTKNPQKNNKKAFQTLFKTGKKSSVIAAHPSTCEENTLPC